MLVLQFTVSLGVSYWLTPVEPYATLNLDDESGLLLFSPDGTMLVTSNEPGRTGPLRIWDVASGHERFSLPHNWKWIDKVLFSPDSSLLAAHARGGELKMWKTTTGEETICPRLASKAGNSLGIQFSPDGRFFVYLDHDKDLPDKQFVLFWSVETGQEQARIEGSFQSLSFAPDGKSFATCRVMDYWFSEVLLWKMDQLPLLTKRHRIKTTSPVVVAPDLQSIATATGLPDWTTEVALWDLITGERRWSVIADEFGGRSPMLWFFADGKILSASVGNLAGRTVLWDVTSMPKKIGSYVEMPAVSPDGKWLAIPMASGAKLIRPSAPALDADLIVNGDSRHGAKDFPATWPQASLFSPGSELVLIPGLWQGGHQPILGNWLPERYNPFRGSEAESFVRVWDTASHRELLALRSCTRARFSPDRRVLATFRYDEANVRWPMAINLWMVPLHASHERILAMAILVWLIAVLISWMSIMTLRKAFSRVAKVNTILEPSGKE